MTKITNYQVNYFQAKLLQWFSKNRRKFPWRYKNISNYKKVIAEVLLQRTKAETVAKFYPIFIGKYPSWNALAKANQSEIEEYIKPIGLNKQRSKRLLELVRTMKVKNGCFPKERNELEKIPFIGQYIANAILLLIHNQPEPLLDVNMARVLERFFGPRKLADIRDDLYLQNLSRRVVKYYESKKINWAIIDFATLVCKKNNPRCIECILSKSCLYKKNS